MSCWRQYKCDVLKDVDPKMIEEALEKLGLKLDTNNHTVVASYERRSANVDGVLTRDGNTLSLGIVFSDETGHLEILGDFWRTGLDLETFKDNLAQQYQKINIENRLTLLGYCVDEDTIVTSQDGSIEFEAYAYA